MYVSVIYVAQSHVFTIYCAPSFLGVDGVVAGTPGYVQRARGAPRAEH